MRTSLLILLTAGCTIAAFAQNVRQLTGSSGAVTGTTASTLTRAVNLAGQPLVGRSQAGNVVNGSGFVNILRARYSALDASLPAGGLPADYAFTQNYPNPFNPSTTFEFALPRTGRVTLRLFDILGREAARVLDNIYPAGQYTISYAAPPELASGMYLACFEAGPFQKVRKVVLLK
jgi:hypothetical protein